MKKPLILVVDDNVDNIAVLEELLKEFDYDFNSINDPTIILDVLEYKMPDLILLDYFMPEQDGLQTLKILKNKPEYAKIPVVVLTADTEKETLSNFFKEGAVDFLHKPINHIELKARISSTLKIANLNHQLKQKVAVVKKQNEEIDMFTNMIFTELSSPIKVIDKYVRIIEKSDDLNIEKIKEYISFIKRAEEGMAFRINNLLDVISVMQGKDLKE
ncbi:MAG: response regulator [Cyanobacteriota bacterium]